MILITNLEELLVKYEGHTGYLLYSTFLCRLPVYKVDCDSYSQFTPELLTLKPL